MTNLSMDNGAVSLSPVLVSKTERNVIWKHCLGSFASICVMDLIVVSLAGLASCSKSEKPEKALESERDEILRSLEATEIFTSVEKEISYTATPHTKVTENGTKTLSLGVEGASSGLSGLQVGETSLFGICLAYGQLIAKGSPLPAMGGPLKRLFDDPIPRDKCEKAGALQIKIDEIRKGKEASSRTK